MSNVQFGLLFMLCGPSVLAVWVALGHARRNTGDTGLARHQPGGLVPANARFLGHAIDVESALREAAAAVIALPNAYWARIDLALEVAMSLHVDPGALGIALQQTMLTAIRAAPGAEILVTAVALGSQLHIRVTDDGPGADQLTRETSTRAAERLIALQGGSVAVEARPGRGTTVTLRLPIPGATGGELCALHRPAFVTPALVALAA